MLRRLLIVSTLAALFGLGCDHEPEHGAHEVPVSKGVSPAADSGPTRKIPMH